MTYKMLGTHGAIICSWWVLVFVWSWQSMEALNEAIGWAPPQSKVSKRSSQNSAILGKQLFTCTWGTRPPLLSSKSGLSLPESMVSHALWHFCTHLRSYCFSGGLHGCFWLKFVGAKSLRTLVLCCKVDGSSMVTSFTRLAHFS
jgi:hypothetical protein